MYSQKKTYIPFIFCCTLIYLVFELAFNARLLDITGRNSTQNDIDNIEFWGRIISGIAVTLAIWGTIILPVLNKRHSSYFTYGTILSLSAFLMIKVVYHEEKKLVDNIVDNSSPEAYKKAVFLNMMRSQILDHNLVINNIDLSKEVFETPQGKTLIALLPFYKINIKNMDDKMKAVVKSTVSNEIYQKIGGNDKNYYNEEYRKENNKIVNMYSQYINIVKVYEKQHDRKEYEYNVRTLTGKVIPMNVSYHDFSLLSKVQDKIQKDLDIATGIPMGLSFEQFDKVYRQIYQTSLNKTMKQIDSNIREYSLNGNQYENGRKAMEAIVAPAIALIISIIGAFVHIFKSGNYFIKMIGFPFGKIIMSMIVAIMIVFGYISGNNITHSPGFHNMEKDNIENIAGIKGKIIAESVKWTIQMQPYFYPVNENIRVHLLNNFTYGTNL